MNCWLHRDRWPFDLQWRLDICRIEWWRDANKQESEDKSISDGLKDDSISNKAHGIGKKYHVGFRLNNDHVNIGEGTWVSWFNSAVKYCIVWGRDIKWDCKLSSNHHCHNWRSIAFHKKDLIWLFSFSNWWWLEFEESRAASPNVAFEGENETDSQTSQGYTNNAVWSQGSAKKQEKKMSSTVVVTVSLSLISFQCSQWIQWIKTRKSCFTLLVSFILALSSRCIVELSAHWLAAWAALKKCLLKKFLSRSLLLI